MVALIAEIEGHCFYIIFSIVVGWCNSMLSCRLLGMLVCITSLLLVAYVSIIYWSVQCHQHTPSMPFCLHDSDALIIDFEQVIISVISFTPLFANRIIIYSTSGPHVPLMLPCLPNPRALATGHEQAIVPVICFLLCLLTRYWFISQVLPALSLLQTYGKLTATFEQVIVPVLLYLPLFVD